MNRNLASHSSPRKKESLKVSAVVLAAGSSSRMKKWKIEIEFEHKPLILYSLETLIAVSNEVIVVGGHNFERLKEILQQIKSRKIDLVKNINYIDGMFSSIKCGIAKTKYDNVFISLADMPFVQNKVYNLLLEEMQRNPDYDYFQPLIALEGKMKKGHPILINKNVKREILFSKHSNTLRDILQKFNGKLIEVNDRGILLDIDTERDIKNAEYIFSKDKIFI